MSPETNAGRDLRFLSPDLFLKWKEVGLVKKSGHAFEATQCDTISNKLACLSAGLRERHTEIGAAIPLWKAVTKVEWVNFEMESSGKWKVVAIVEWVNSVMESSGNRRVGQIRNGK